MIDWRRALVYTHRWMGIVGGLLFVAWFTSGIVMMYARMPEMPASDVLDRIPALDLSSARLSPASVVGGGERVDRLRVTTLLGRPIYRIQSGRTAITAFADTGERVDLSVEHALAVIRTFAPEHAQTLHYDALITEPDQWTLGVRAQLPLHRVAAGDGGDTYYYVAQHSGDIAMRTTRRERLWAYPGAVLHWLYFTPFRKQAALWNRSIIWLSAAGCVLCITGLTWGLMVVRKSPYSGLMKWHHYAGLIFGVTSLMFVFSGLLSMGPFIGDGTAPTRAQRERVAGGSLKLQSITIERLRRFTGGCKELELQMFRGLMFAPCSLTDPFPNDLIEQAARDAMPEVAIRESRWLRDYDSYYYARGQRLSLPVLRVKYADADGTWLYFDPRRGAIVRRENQRSRIERWLYHGFHSFDFPFLYNRRPLWDVVMIALSIGGLVLSATTLLPGWRRVRRLVKRTP